jgi:hypothetical protein
MLVRPLSRFCRGGKVKIFWECGVIPQLCRSGDSPKTDQHPSADGVSRAGFVAVVLL